MKKKISQPEIELVNKTAEVSSLPSVTDRHIWDALRQCYDPEIPVNIVDLGLVYEVKVEEELPGDANVYIRMTLTAPGCGHGTDDCS